MPVCEAGRPWRPWDCREDNCDDERRSEGHDGHEGAAVGQCPRRYAALLAGGRDHQPREDLDARPDPAGQAEYDQYYPDHRDGDGTCLIMVR